jgi:hypothetical protein
VSARRDVVAGARWERVARALDALERRLPQLEEEFETYGRWLRTKAELQERGELPRDEVADLDEDQERPETDEDDDALE